MVKNIVTLGNYDQRRLWKLIFIVYPFDLSLKEIHKNRTFNWLIRIKNGGKYHYEINVFLTLGTIIGSPRNSYE